MAQQIIRDEKGRIVEGAPQQTNKYGTAGAPSKYKPEYAAQMIAFFSKPPTHIKKKPFVTKQGLVLANEDGKPIKVPVEVTTELITYEDFALKLKVPFSTIKNWAHAKNEDGSPKHPDFLAAYQYCGSLQERLIAKNAMAGRYNGPFAQFYLKNKHKWVDKQEVEGNFNFGDHVGDKRNDYDL